MLGECLLPCLVTGVVGLVLGWVACKKNVV